MTQFYESPDIFFWPVIVNDGNDEVSVTEDVGGGSEVTITATLPQSSTLASDVFYYAVGAADPASKSTAGNISVLDDPDDTLIVRPLYDEIAEVLTDESTASGLGLTYEFSADTPSGSDQTNSGITLTTTSGTTNIQLDFTASNQIDPRYFGYDESDLSSSSGTSITGPYSRWGNWQSPIVRAAHDKRQTIEHETFQSTPDPYKAKVWRFTRKRRIRRQKYIGVAGAHVWPDDRAGRSAESARAGLPADDDNNTLYDLWRFAHYSDYRVLVGQGVGTGDLVDWQTALNVGKITGEFRSMFEPQNRSDREHSGERYDVTIPVAITNPDHYATGVTVWRH